MSDIATQKRNAQPKLGRPTQSGERYPSGKLKPADKRDNGPAPAVIKKTFDKALRGGGDPLIGTSLGLLFMTGKITALDLAAGIALAKLWGRYDRAMGMPGRFTLSPDYGTARQISNREPMDEVAIASLKDRFARTMAELGVGWTHYQRTWHPDVTVGGRSGEAKKLSGEAARSAHLGDCWRTVALLERVCVDDLACEGYELPRLKAALDLLVSWFGVDR